MRTLVSPEAQYAHACEHPLYALMVCRNVMRDWGGTRLMICFAFTWRNSRPRYSPMPTCRSTSSSSENSMGWPPSSSANRHRKPSPGGIDRHSIEHMFDVKGASTRG